MSNFEERLDNEEEFYDDVRYWFEEWLDDLGESKQFEFFNKAMDNFGYHDDILFENTPEAINSIFKNPYEALKAQRNGNYNIDDRFFSYPDLISYSNIPYDEYITEMLDDMIKNPSSYGVHIESLYENDRD